MRVSPSKQQVEAEAWEWGEAHDLFHCLSLLVECAAELEDQVGRLVASVQGSRCGATLTLPSASPSGGSTNKQQGGVGEVCDTAYRMCHAAACPIIAEGKQRLLLVPLP